MAGGETVLKKTNGWEPVFRVGCAVLLAGYAPQLAQAAPKAASVVYVVQQGDTLSGLAARSLLTIDAARTLQQINRIADPRRIPVGFKLVVPIRLLRQEGTSARIRSFSGPVVVTVAGRRLPAAPGMTLAEGSMIETGTNAFVSLDLPDRSVVTMPSQSKVRISRLRRTLLTGSVDRQFDVGAGRLRAVVTPMGDPRSSFRVTTPVAVSAVRGTEFRVSYDPVARRGATEVLTGKVAVAPPRRPGIVVVPGFAAATGGATGRPSATALLAAPDPVGNPGTQRDATLSFAAAPVAGAARYRLQIARDAGFLDLLVETDADEPRFTLPALDDGTYFSRISAVDPNGIEGLSNIYGFRRQLHALTASMEQRSEGGRRDYLFRWRDAGQGAYSYRFQLARCGDGQRPVVDQGNATGLGLVVSDLPDGTYCWRVQSIALGDGTGDVIWSETQRFTITK